MSTFRNTVQQYHTVLKQYPWKYRAAILNPLGAVMTSVGLPYFAGLSLASAATQDGNFTRYITLTIAVCLLGVLMNRLFFIQIMRLQATTMKDLNTLVFKRTLQRGMSYHNNNIGGKLVSDTLDYVSSYSALTLALFTNLSSFVLTLVIGLAVVFVQSWQLGLFLSLVVMIMLATSYLDSRNRSRRRTIRHVAEKDLTAHYSDSLVNAPTIKAFGSEDREIATNQQKNHKLESLRLDDWVVAGTNGNNRIAFLLAAAVGLLLLYNYLVTSNPEVIGLGIFAFTYTFTLILRLFEINNLVRVLEDAFLKARPTADMLAEDIEIQDSPNATTLQVSDGAIDISSMSFAYSDDPDTNIFSNLNLQIKPNQKIGLVGSSGGGKSTLTKLLLRFEDITDGSITIDGQDIRAVTQQSLRNNIGYVPQEPLLFHRSVRENIAYGREEEVTDQELIRIAKLAHAHEFITDLPDGYDTIVGERGVKLSGGQRQRIAIARAMLKDAPILILDEATSALDSESEILIQQALWKLMEGRTAIVIAHRLSTIQKMDRILVLENGQIIEQGTHKQLLKKKNGQYARLWKHQSGGFLQE